MATNTTQKQAAKQFVKDWTGKGYEKGETQRFWLDLLHNVFGVDDPTKVMQFEIPVKTITKEKGADFIDGYITSTKVLIEQKGSHVDLSTKAKQSDGAELTPYQQARRYATGLPLSMAPRWIVACNFTTFEVHDMEHPNDAPEVIRLADLEKEYHRLAFLVDDTNAHIKKELEVSIKAGEIVGMLYDKILTQYKDPNSLESQKALNKLCVRLVFCLYAEDAGIFEGKNMFHDYMAQFSAADFRSRLIELFHVLDIKPEDRDPYMDEKLAAFPYVNGGMFSGDIEIPRINEEIRDLILQRASDDFDWSQISPTIFGAVFESTLNPETRRAGGMHYTSIENIHKVIDPLFLDDLKAEWAIIKATTIAKAKREKALAFQNKLASLKFLDPACGSGNFLTESYTSLRRLENEALREIALEGMGALNLDGVIKVSINQFYGIEINDFACAVAQTALWIAESQMMQETSEIVGFDLDPLPLRKYTNIREGNALRMNWSVWEDPDDLTTVYADEVYIHQYLPSKTSSFIVREPEARYGTIELHSHNIHPTDKTPRTRYVEFDYIMGNPPFVGQKLQSEAQKGDLAFVFGEKHKGLKMLDYVAGWYKKTMDLMKIAVLDADNSHNTKYPHAALVSTNSICQGESIEDLWALLFKEGVHIDFAYRTFRWDSEADIKAHVHCVIVGFSIDAEPQQKTIFDHNQIIKANNINGYLVDAPNVVVSRNSRQISGAPNMTKGAQLIDGGGFMINSDEEREAFLSKYPEAEPYIYRYYNAKDFLNNVPAKYCLYLKHCPPQLMKSCKGIYDRIQVVHEFRANSDAKTTRLLKDTPSQFFQSQVPEQQSIVIPVVSSENRKYIPMRFMPTGNVYTNALFYVDNADLYSFGILTSIVHMAWTRVVCGRLKSDYRYSNDIVYNNFPFPSPTNEQQAKIEETAQKILDVRTQYNEASLADLYDETLMPIELRRAHHANDAAVMEAYGFSPKMTENEIVAELFKLYKELVSLGDRQ